MNWVDATARCPETPRTLSHTRARRAHACLQSPGTAIKPVNSCQIGRFGRFERCRFSTNLHPDASDVSG
jgi:hypothetical protein